MSSSFGKWYEEQKAEEAGTGSSSSWFESEQVLPLFSTEGMPNLSFDSMKTAMEAQMPKKILGMGYQQRFKVCMDCMIDNRLCVSGHLFLFLFYLAFLI